MLNFLKNLFRKSPAEPEPQRVPPPAPNQQAPVASAPSAKPTAFKKLPLPEGPTLQVSLAAIRAGLPATVKAAQNATEPSTKCSVLLPRSRVVSQLPTGTVRFTFAELFSWAPAGTLAWCEGEESTEVSVPLSEILPKLSPADYPKRTGQAQTAVPDDIANLFGPKGAPPRPVAVGFRSIAPSAPPSQPAPRPSSASTEALSAHPESPAAGQVDNPNEALAKAEPATQHPTEPAASEPVLIKPLSALPTPESLRPKAGGQASSPKAPQPVSSAETIELPVEILAGHFQGELGVHLRAISTTDSKVLIPLTSIEAGMKKGRVLMPIKEVASLVSPPIHTSQIAGMPDQEVELPMALLVPLFMAAKRPQRDQKKTTIPDHIPDLFKSAGPVPTSADSTEITTIQSPPAQPPPSKPVTPQGILEALTTIDGVVGALISLEDGMLVAAKLPTGIDPDFVAAFVPGVFQKGRELLKALNVDDTGRLTLPQAAFDIQLLPAGRSLLLLLVRPGANLPDSVLNNHIASLKKQTAGL